MKAVIYDKKATPEKLVYREAERPVPNDDEILVKVSAASINAADYRTMKSGMVPKKKIFGADISGVVVSAGGNIRQFKPGDHVVGDLAKYGFGGLAEYALAPEHLLVHKPTGVSFEDAAALPMAAQTALQGLRDKGRIQPGHEVLVIGSGGGVGTFAVQLAKYFGARVTAVCSPGNIEQSKALGADEVIDYTREDFTKGPHTYDLILAVNGNYPLLACRRKLKPGGTYVMVGGAIPQVLKSLLFGWALSAGSRKVRSFIEKTNQEDLGLILKLADEGRIRPVIDARYPLKKAAEAMKYASEGHASGKIVINIS